MHKWITLIFLLVASTATAQEIEGIEELSLEDLLNIKTSVASKTEKSTRETPGIVTVLTREELKRMGARDLMDALKFVPGIHFGYDIQGQVSLGIRGNWAQEGKFSLIIDDLEMNELLYSGTAFGNHYPIDHIKTIEIIRGPGSAIYGGFAELAVIKVSTEKGSDLKGGKVIATYGQMKEDFGRRNLSLQYGKKVGDWDISAAGLVGQARRGDGKYTEYTANDGSQSPPTGNIIENPNYYYGVYDFSEGKANNLNPAWLNIGANWKNKTDIRVIYDNYRTTARSLYGLSNLPRGVSNNFESLHMGIKHEFAFGEGDRFKITPYLQYKRQAPWNQQEPDTLAGGASLFDVIAKRVKGGVSGFLDFGHWSNLLVGIEYYKDEAEIKTQNDGTTDIPFTMTNSNTIDFDGLAAYVQDAIKFDELEFTVGARWEQLKTPNGRKVERTVPRFAATYTKKDWHAKALASQAYRVPSIINFESDFAANNASTLVPEVTTTFEIEGGYRVTPKSYLTLNVFHTNIKDPIIYANNMGTDLYANATKVGTRGAELEYKVKYSKGFTNMNYSFYERGTNEVATYSVPNSKELLGFPQHKATILTSYKPEWEGFNNLTINPSLVYMSAMHSWQYSIQYDDVSMDRIPDALLANLYVAYPDLFLKGLELGVGVFNIFDHKTRIVQPYDGGIGNIPGASREFLTRLTYSLNF